MGVLKLSNARRMHCEACPRHWRSQTAQVRGAVRGSREGWARGFTRRLRKESPNSAGPKSLLLQTFFGLLLITFTYTKHLMRP